MGGHFDVTEFAQQFPDPLRDTVVGATLRAHHHDSLCRCGRARRVLAFSVPSWDLSSPKSAQDALWGEADWETRAGMARRVRAEFGESCVSTEILFWLR